MIDALCLLGEDRFGPGLDVEEALEVASSIGVTGLVAAPARPRGYHLEPANEDLAARAAGSRGRLAVLGRIDPLEGPRGVAEAERCLHDLGCVGLFLHPAQEVFPVRRARPIVEVAASYGAPVVIATGSMGLSEAGQVAELAATSPSVSVVMTSGGQLDITGLSMGGAWLALTSAPNLHVLTDGQYRQDYLERLAGELDHRVLFASFAPRFDQRYEAARIRSARMSDQARQAIEHDNAVRLFRLPGSAA